MNSGMAGEQFWAERSVYEEAEQKYYEKRIGPSMSSKVTLTPLADEVAKARQRLINIRDSFEISAEHLASDTCSMGSLEKKYLEFERVLNTIKDQITRLDERLRLVELRYTETKGDRTKPCAICVEKIETTTKTDDDVDLFASDSDDDEADQLKQQRLADYHAKKSKKPVLIAKSSIVLDVKPWDDETDMKLMEENVRKIEMEGMLWGASKLVPLAYGINKLQISCIVEDEKVSVDLLQEQIEDLEDYVQSVDIAAFNKI